MSTALDEIGRPKAWISVHLSRTDTPRAGAFWIYAFVALTFSGWRGLTDPLSGVGARLAEEVGARWVSRMCAQLLCGIGIDIGFTVCW
ncbi:hypothetical protein D3C79_862410 [compost metagenome]